MEFLANASMDWIQFAITIITFAGLFVWNRTESRADIRHLDTKLESNRELMRVIHSETRELIGAIQAEMKDFHGRLCTIEERNKKSN